jgi:hypothetical protein
MRKDLWWRADYYRHLKYRGGCTIPLFQLSVWCEKCVGARHYTDIGIQLFISNDRNRVRWVVASHRMGPAPICLKISARIAERETYRMRTLSTRLFSLVNIVPLINYLQQERKFLWNFLEPTVCKKIIPWQCHFTLLSLLQVLCSCMVGSKYRRFSASIE